MQISKALTDSMHNDSHKLQCMTVLNEPIKIQHKGTRSHKIKALNLLERYERWLKERTGFKKDSVPYIRGSSVASDNLLIAFLRYSNLIDFTFGFPDGKEEIFEKECADLKLLGIQDLVSLEPLSRVLRYKAGQMDIDCWLDLRGDTQYILNLRHQLGACVAPTISVQHSVSNHYHLYHKFFRILLSPHYECDSIVCSSRASKQAVSKTFHELTAQLNYQLGSNLVFRGRIDTIPLCVDTHSFRPRDKINCRKVLNLTPSKIILLYVGYLSQVKADLIPFLSVLQKLIKTNHDKQINLFIAGTGPETYLQYLEEAIECYSLHKNVTVMVNIDETKKELLYGAADIFVAPCDSLQESFGLTPIEAMASGLPQVVADWSGYRDTVVHGETGFLVPTLWGDCDGDFSCTGDTLGWAYDHISQALAVSVDLALLYDYLQLLIKNEELRARFASNSRNRAVNKFSSQVVCKQYDELWRELHEAAKKTQRTAETRYYDQPHYFERLGHFATTALRVNTMLRVHEETFSAEQLQMITRVERPGHILDEQLIQSLINSFENEFAPEMVSVGQVINMYEGDQWRSSEIRRHLLILIKHGFLRVC